VTEVALAEHNNVVKAFGGEPGPLPSAILAAMVEQAGKLTLTCRAFHNDQLVPLYQQIVEHSGSHKVLPLNSGAEAVERAQVGLRG